MINHKFVEFLIFDLSHVIWYKRFRNKLNLKKTAKIQKQKNNRKIKQTIDKTMYNKI